MIKPNDNLQSKATSRQKFGVWIQKYIYLMAVTMTDLAGGYFPVYTGRVDGIHEEVRHIQSMFDGYHLQTEQMAIDALSSDDLKSSIGLNYALIN